MPWIGVDLDGTLAHYEGWVSAQHIGAPVVVMVERVKGWLAEGYEVRVFTARVAGAEPEERVAIVTLIEQWCLAHLGVVLPVTCQKDFGMVELWDDRCVAVEPNTGRPLNDSRRRLE